MLDRHFQKFQITLQFAPIQVHIANTVHVGARYIMISTFKRNPIVHEKPVPQPRHRQYSKFIYYAAATVERHRLLPLDARYCQSKGLAGQLQDPSPPKKFQKRFLLSMPVVVMRTEREQGGRGRTFPPHPLSLALIRCTTERTTNGPLAPPAVFPHVHGFFQRKKMQRTCKENFRFKSSSKDMQMR